MAPPKRRFVARLPGDDAESVLIADAHNDLLLELVLRRDERNPFGAHWLEQLRNGGVGLQVCPVYVADLAPDAQRDAALAQIDAFECALAANPDACFPVRWRGDLASMGEGRIGLVLALEGAEALGSDPGAIDELWTRGVRIVGLTWNYANAFAGGIDTPDRGLTARGRELVERLAELGVTIDLAHASEQAFSEVLDAVPSAQVLVTHAGCRAVHDHPRNVSDDQLRALAERNGVLGVMALTVVVGPDAPTLDRFVDHLEHAASVMGSEHVGLGADFIDQVIAAEVAAGKKLAEATREAMRAGGGTLAIRELQRPADYPALAARLRQRGYDGERLDAILHGNLLRVLGAALPDAA